MLFRYSITYHYDLISLLLSLVLFCNLYTSVDIKLIPQLAASMNGIVFVSPCSLRQNFTDSLQPKLPGMTSMLLSVHGNLMVDDQTACESSPDESACTWWPDSLFLLPLYFSFDGADDQSEKHCLVVIGKDWNELTSWVT